MGVADLTLYDILGVPKTSTFEEIAQAYNELAKKYSPDEYEGNAEVGKRCLQEVNEAYAILSDEEKRNAYDNALSPQRYVKRKLRGGEIAFLVIFLLIALVCAGYVLDSLEIIDIIK